MNKLTERSLRVIAKYIFRGNLYHDIQDEIVVFPHSDIFAAYYAGPFSLKMSYALLMWSEAFDIEKDKNAKDLQSMCSIRQSLRLMLETCGKDSSGRFDLRKADQKRMQETLYKILHGRRNEELYPQESILHNAIIESLIYLVRFKESMLLEHKKKQATRLITQRPVLTLVH